MKALIVEDNESLGRSIRSALADANFVVDQAASFAAAETALEGGAPYDLILLDLGLPDGDGLALLRDLRASRNNTAVIVITARGGLNDRIEGLDDGADDYLVKPFELRELVSRCRALMRRPDRMNIEPVRIGRLEMDLATQEMSIGGRPVVVSRREQRLLGALVRRAGRVCTRAYLEQLVYEQDDDVSPNALETVISRLRAFLANADAGLDIRTIRGVGYLLRSSHDS